MKADKDGWIKEKEQLTLEYQNLIQQRDVAKVELDSLNAGNMQLNIENLDFILCLFSLFRASPWSARTQHLAVPPPGRQHVVWDVFLVVAFRLRIPGPLY